MWRGGEGREGGGGRKAVGREGDIREGGEGEWKERERGSKGWR